MDESRLLSLLALVREGEQAREELLGFVRSFFRERAGYHVPNSLGTTSRQT
jgi:hypothetical protein